LDLQLVKELMSLLEKSKLRKMSIREKNGFEISLEKEHDHPAPDRREQSKYEAVLNVPQTALEKPAVPEKTSGEFITSPMVGTFYASPSPDDPYFVTVGDKVTKDTVVCIIEAMKVMNEVKAMKSGTITKFLAENMQAVEFGTKLFEIE